MNTLAGILKKVLGTYNLRSLWQRRAVFGIIGAIGGFAYYHYIGCTTGACPITGNPYISTAYGTLIGLLIPTSKNNKPSEDSPH